MPLADHTLSDGRTVRSTIADAVCQHLPSAAFASGLVTPVDMGAWLAAMSERFPIETRPIVGFTTFRRWLADQGVDAGERWARALFDEWLRQEMAAFLSK